ncbi:restriction endonuclease subunit S [Chryseobacterium bernardetii]|uniref:restriction endonuclease subunit S n=1 Tax=Chryseobacterium bernardetii TaxID=1241978 RepID=UPI001E2D6F62|nr:restriction endonuclease subunit S [Chryseobacterium bernardetii]
MRFPEFTEEWKTKKLGEVMDFKVTNSFSRENLNYEIGTVKNIHYGDIHTKFQTLFDIMNETVPFINDEINVVRISDENYCREGDVIFADASEDLNDVGKSIEIINLNGEKLLSGLHTLLGRPKSSVFHLGFNGYLFKSNSVRTQIQKESQGSKVLSINVGRISKIELSFPSVNEQERITILLSLLDERIQTQNKIIEELKLLKNTISKKIFLRQLRFKDNKGIDFQNWETKKLKDVCEIVGGGTPETNKSEYWNGNIQWFTPTEIKSNFISKSERTISHLGLKNSSAKLLPKGTILLTTRATIGEVSITLEECTTNQGFQSLIVKEDCNNIFIFNWLKVNKYELEKRASGSTFAEISKSEIEKIQINIPNIEEQAKIANSLSSIDLKIDTEVKFLQKLKEQKKYVLENLFIEKD